MPAKNSYIIWDVDEAISESTSDKIILWNGYNQLSDNNIISIPERVEKYSDKYRKRYLRYIYELGEKKVEGKTIVDSMIINKNFSYWWMTLIFEKSNFSKSPEINDIIKLFSLLDFLKVNKVSNLSIVTTKPNLINILKKYCRSSGIEFNYKIHYSDSHSGLSKVKSFILNIIPDSILVIIWLYIYLIKNSYLVKQNKSLWRKSNSEVTFITYMDNLIINEDDEYQSLYWTKLIDYLKKNNIKTRWLHIWTKNKDAKDSYIANKLVNNWNKNDNVQFHCTLNSFLSIHVLINSYNDYRKLKKISCKLEKELAICNKNEISLWPMLYNDWVASTRGIYLVSNILMFHLFESAFKNNLNQKVGFYLQENQAWEYALLYNWNTFQNKNIIGVAHSTIRFWDLRYYFDKRFYQSDYIAFIFPQFMAVNSLNSKKNIIDSGYPEKKLIEVEALRYLYLEDVNTDRINSESFNLLILGDYENSSVKFAFELLSNSLKNINFNINLIYKPHPNSIIDQDDFFDLNITLTNESLYSLLKFSDVVFSCNTTSASVDAYCYGLDVIICLDPRCLNLSPLRELNEVYFVSKPDQLRNIINTLHSKNKNIYSIREYFHVDQNLNNWDGLINKYLF
jgi:surface carbohydrate biosynthesis protein (TIGR04326 family)